MVHKQLSCPLGLLWGKLQINTEDLALERRVSEAFKDQEGCYYWKWGEVIKEVLKAKQLQEVWTRVEIRIGR